MNPESVSRLTEYLKELRAVLKEFPELASRYESSIKALEGASQKMLSQRAPVIGKGGQAVGEGGIGGPGNLVREWENYFNRFEAAQARGNKGIQQRVALLRDMHNVSRAIIASNEQMAAGLGTSARLLGQGNQVPGFETPMEMPAPLDTRGHLERIKQERQERERLTEDIKLETEALKNNRRQRESAGPPPRTEREHDQSRQNTRSKKEEQVATDDLTKSVNALNEARAKRVESNQASILGAFDGDLNAYQRFTDMLKQNRVDLAGNVRVYRDASSGLQEMTVISGDAENAGRRMSVRWDEMNNIFQVSQGRFRTFTDAMTRNIAEVAKWSASVAVVYGSIDALNRLVQQAISNQAKLAEVQIVLGTSSENLNGIFREALTIARATGSSVDGVLDSYTDAIRVTAGIADETERFREANKLLSDSLVLSKLGAFEQKEAMDLLIASLNQINSPLSEGSVLLDKWVATTKVAGVGLKDLATAFSITAGAAEIAGIQVGGMEDELSGLIAMIAEQFPYEGRELGNRVRALIAGFGDPSRQGTLFNLGVSPVDAEGQIRPWLDIMRELNSLYTQQILTEKQIGDIAGNNARERNILIASIKNLTRAEMISAETANSSGAAQQALGIQLETVQTAINKMSNAFANLAQTLGTDGGVLEAVTTIVEGLTSLINVLNAVVQATGTAGVALTTFLAGSAIYGSAFKISGGLIGGLSRIPGGTQRRAVGGNLTAAAVSEGRFSESGLMVESMLSPLRTFAGNILPGLIATGINAALIEENRTGERVGAQIAGAFVGSFMGPMGSVIGSQIALGFVEAVEQRRDFKGIGEEISQAFLLSLTREADTNQSGQQRRENDLDRYLEQTSSERDWFLDIADVIAGGLNDFVRFFSSGDKGTEYFQRLTDRGVDPTILSKIIEEISLGESQIGWDRLDQVGDSLSRGSATPQEINKLLGDLLKAQEIVVQNIEKQEEWNKSISNLPNNKIDELNAQLREAWLDDRIDDKTFIERTDRIQNAALQAEGALRAFAQDTPLTDLLGVESLEEAKDLLTEFYLLADPAVAQKTQTLFNVPEDTEDKLKAINEQVKEYAFLVLNAERSNLRLSIDDIEAPSVIDVADFNSQDEINEWLSHADYLATVYTEALAASIAANQGIAIDAAREMAQEMVDAQREIHILYANDMYAPYETAGKQFLDVARNQIKQQNQQQRTSFGVQDIDLPSSSWGQIQKTMNYFGSQLGQLGYIQNKSPQLVKFSDGTMMVKDVDSQLLQLALNELIEVNRDQLEGIYNLPSDASFYVPFTGYKLGFGEGGGLTSPLSSIDIANSDQFTTAGGVMLQAGNLMLQAAQMEQIEGKPLPDWNPSEQVNVAVQEELRRFQQGQYGSQYNADGLKNSIDTMAQTLPVILSNTLVKGMDERRFREGQYGAMYGADVLNSPITVLSSSVESLSQSQGELASAIQMAVDKVPPLNLRIQLQSVSQLNLDGRLIANSVKNHIVQDLLRFQGSGGGATISYVV